MRGVAKNVALVGVQGLAALAHHLHRPKPGLQRSLDVLVDPQLCPGPLPPACNRAAARTRQCTVYGTKVCTYDQNSTCMLLHSHRYCQKPTLPGSGASRGSNVQGQLPCAQAVRQHSWAGRQQPLHIWAGCWQECFVSDRLLPEGASNDKAAGGRSRGAPFTK